MSTSASQAWSFEDPRLAECWLVRVGVNVVGPVSLDQIERGLAEGRIPQEADMAHVEHRRWCAVADLVPLSARPEDNDARRRISGVQPTFVQRPEAPSTPAPANTFVPTDQVDSGPGFPEDSIEIPKHGWLRSLFG